MLQGLGILSLILPDLITTIELVSDKNATGPAKQAQALHLLQTALLDAGVAGWLVTLLLSIAKAIIPVLVAKFNADPANTIFTKPSSA
jgi:hypothetical protein